MIFIYIEHAGKRAKKKKKKVPGLDFSESNTYRLDVLQALTAGQLILLMFTARLHKLRKLLSVLAV